MSRFDGVVACEVPREFRGDLRQRVVTLAVVQWITECLKLRCPSVGKMQQTAAVIAANGNDIACFFGTSYYYTHPVLRPGASHYAAMAAESSGFRRFLLAAKFDRIAPAGQVLFSGDETERIAEYCEGPGQSRVDARLLQYWNDGNHELLDLRSLLPHPKGGTTIREVKTAKILSVVKRFDQGITHQQMLKGETPSGFEKWCRRHLHKMLANSRSDGKTVPGRKAHAACIMAPDGRCVFACNSPADVEVLDCCSERAAARIAASASILPFSVVAIASGSYPVNGGLEMCDVCKATLAHHIHDGNTLVLYFESGKHARRTWISRVTRPYAFTDGNTTFVEPLGSDGYFF